MSFTNSTTNYGLPQWIGTDKPTYLVDQNGAYATIDRELYNANSNASTALSSASSAVEVAGTAATNAQTAIDSAATANTNANSAIATANTALTNAASALSLANDLQSDVESLSTIIDEHTYTSTSTTNADVLNTVGTAISNVLTDYPEDEYEYIVTLIDETNALYTRFFLARETSESMYGTATSSSVRDLVVAVDLAGSTSKMFERIFTSSGVSQNEISSSTVSSNLKVRVQASKI